MASDLQSVLQQDEAFQEEKQKLKKKIQAQQEAKVGKLHQSIRELKAELKSLKSKVDEQVAKEAEQLKSSEAKRLDEGRAEIAAMSKKTAAVAEFIRQQVVA